MPQSEGGYVSLGGDGLNSAIYNATTEPTGPQSVYESVKRAIGQVVGNGHSGSQDATLLTPKGKQPMIVGSRDRDKTGKTLLNTKMPSAPAHTAEEARLLGTMPVDPMDDIELRSVHLQFPHARGSIIDACDQRRVPTDKGDILVAIQGDQSKPAIVTYHDLGLNFATSFAGFFNFPVMRGLLDNFCVYHVTAPGQEEGAPTLPEDYVYPSIDELASQLLFVLSHFGLKNVIGFGVGVGGNILARFAHHNPDKVGALCLINCVSTSSGWIEWGYQSFNARFLRTKGMTQGVVDYLMWHHFGRNPEERNHDLVQIFKHHFEQEVNPTNLAMFINAYINRSDLNINRTPPNTPGQQSAATLKMPVINITGALSPHVDDTVTLNGRLDPTNSTWMKISDCAMVLEEQPAKVAEAFRLFLQGEGYATPLSSPTTTPTGNMMGASSTILYHRYLQQQRLIQQQKQLNQQNAAAAAANAAALTSFNNNNSIIQQDTDNGNSIITNPLASSALSQSSSTANSTTMDNDYEITDDDTGGGNLSFHSIGNTNNNLNKIRITENPLPETIPC